MITTCPERRGFGLHVSANAAVEMGGTLTCRSAGAGRGSTFRLDIPIAPGSRARTDLIARNECLDLSGPE